jgi:hypothetical protein
MAQKEKCTTNQLIIALCLLDSVWPADKRITAIQFEDGSGFKFNIQVNGGEWEFLDMTEHFRFL